MTTNVATIKNPVVVVNIGIIGPLNGKFSLFLQTELEMDHCITMQNMNEGAKSFLVSVMYF